MACVKQGLGLAIGATLMDLKRATTLASVTVMTFMLAGGFFVQVKTNIPVKSLFQIKHQTPSTMDLELKKIDTILNVKFNLFGLVTIVNM